MRLSLAASVAVLGLAGTALAVPPAVSAAGHHATASQPSSQGSSRQPSSDRQRATAALARAEAILGTSAPSSSGTGARPTAGSGRDATLALSDLFASMGALSPAQRTVARGLLARPTDGPKDPYHEGYSVPAKKKCQGHFCVHWVTSTVDAAPGRAWVKRMLKLMNHVWKVEIGRLGYRQPPSDRGRGGSDKVDVYLKELRSEGLYGYCAPERRKPGYQWLASGYCVLDNDFAGFPRSAIQSAEVTAAHEFFHLVQFGYDFGEDPWLLEATAVWMEEQVFDGVNDNRQYLPDGQVAQPLVPLDYFGQLTNQQYGNWPFFEWLSHKYGTGIVQQIWNKAAAFAGAPDLYSTQAITNVLKPKGGFKKIYAQIASAYALPAKFFPEGKSWTVLDSLPSALAGEVTLSRGARRTGELGKALLHMSSATYQVKSSSTLRNRKWHLKIKIDGPKSFRMPAAYVLVIKRKGHDAHFVRLNGKGNGQIIVPFSRRKVKSVYVSLVDASTRFRCAKRTQYSCGGLPIDDGTAARGQRYSFTARVIKH
jgi:hypothetical protein